VDLRRIALAVIPALGVVLTSGVSAAQQVAKVPRVGYLPSASVGPTPTTPNRLFEAFRKGLGDLGYIEGRDIVIEPRWAEGRVERLPELAAELVGLKVDIIATTGAVAARAAKNATTTIPVVMAVVIDPVAGGLVSNLQRPGGNVTGLTTYDPQQPRKQIEILKEVIPGLARLALLGDQDVRAGLLRANEEQARALGLQTQSYLVGAPDPDLEGAFDAATKGAADALLVLEQPATIAHRKRIAELAAKHRLPTLFARDYVDAGGLIAYGASLAEAGQRMSAYVDKIIKGAEPDDLPIEAVTRHELIINLKTAHEIGVTIPPEVLKRADQETQ